MTMKIYKLLIIVFGLCYLSASPAKTFKIATAAPDGTYWMKQIRAGAKEIKMRTNGRVKFKFYPGGVMGSEEVVMKKIRIHQLQGAAVSNGILGRFYPESQIYALPMLFNNFAEVDYIRNIFDRKIIEGLEKGGMISFGLSEGGFSYVMSTRPINKTGDLSQYKVWTPTNNKQAEMTLKSIGISPIPLNLGDVLPSLQTNLIDTVTVVPIGAIALQWHTQIKHVANVPLMYVYATLLIDKNEFNKIGRDDRNIVKEILGKVFKRIDQKNRKDNLSAFNALSNQGIEIFTPDKNDLKKWYAEGEKARQTIRSGGIMSERMIEDVIQYLTEFRKKHESAGEAR